MQSRTMLIAGTDSQGFIAAMSMNLTAKVVGTMESLSKRWPNIFPDIKNNFPDMPLLIPCSKRDSKQSSRRVTSTKPMR